jgi:purine-cytosine permease-like protein
MFKHGVVTSYLFSSFLAPMPVFWMWLAANLTISTFSLGTLGFSIFQLGLRESVLVILLFNLLTTIPVAYFSTWGPKLGREFISFFHLFRLNVLSGVI